MPLVIAGAVAMALLAVIVVFSSVVGWPLLVLPGDLTSRGLVALLVIAIAMGVWAVAERDLLLGLVVCVFFVVALVSCTYDLSNVASFGSSPGAAEIPNVVIPGLYLLLAGVGLAVLDRIGEGRARPGSVESAAR